MLDGDPGAKISAGKNAQFAFSGFSVRVEHLFPLFTGTEISLLQTIVDGFRSARFYPASSRLALDCHKLLLEVSPQMNLHHRGQLLRLAAAVLNEEFQNANGQRVGYISTEDHWARVFENFSPEEMVNLSVPELARKFGCSRHHLNRLFQEYFGVSVACLRMEMRLLKAVSLLRDTGAKVINVAEQCGFNHLGLFNICFRRRFGTSPGQWRKEGYTPSCRTIQQAGQESDCPLRLTGLCLSPDNRATAQSGSLAKDLEHRVIWRPADNHSPQTLAKTRSGKRRP